MAINENSPSHGGITIVIHGHCSLQKSEKIPLVRGVVILSVVDENEIKPTYIVVHCLVVVAMVVTCHRRGGDVATWW